jgi:hypothetical protein
LSRFGHAAVAILASVGVMDRSATLFLALATLALAHAAHAQPAPTFQARCGELRQAMASLQGREEDELITIEVVGPLAFLRDAGGIVYLGLCGPPDPRVLCVTYETMGRKLGDRVVVTGSILPRGPDFIQLDPCLHHEPTPEDKD